MSLLKKHIALQYGSSVLSLKKDDVLFHEGDTANFFYQVEEGAVKMVTYSLDGKEFIQGLFYQGDSFGEPPLFCDFPYPGSANALIDSKILRVPKDRFFDLLKDNFDVHVQLDRILCERLKYKNMILSEISFYDPEHRILSLLGYLKSKAPSSDQPFQVPLTRQQLADMSGMRVETVIRTIRRMEETGKLQLQDHKIFF
jgi:CRP/FNR family transcriptional regulator, cyclic AMP receptor protein